MRTLSPREQLINKVLNELSDEQVKKLLAQTEAMPSDALPPEYDPDNDPAIGFLSGSTDLAQRSKEILRDEITSRSGWTQKKDT